MKEELLKSILFNDKNTRKYFDICSYMVYKTTNQFKLSTANADNHTIEVIQVSILNRVR